MYLCIFESVHKFLCSAQGRKYKNLTLKNITSLQFDQLSGGVQVKKNVSEHKEAISSLLRPLKNMCYSKTY